ncbi:MAG: hypothetical protein JOZ75_05775 [Candidatus Dormibacteraeota bacterium]|nr:hypothetical protein [Candidatus Dormibacteraeota bacterium]
MPDREHELVLPGTDEAARLHAALREEGTRPCTEGGCAATTGIVCAYVDRRRHRCPTAWCPAHRLVLGERVYCRRHAGVVSAIGVSDPIPTTTFPDLENRAPSLAAWVARAIDGDVWGILLEELGNEAGGQLLADPVSLSFQGFERRRAWERAWKLVTRTGVARRVSVMVEEADDATVLLKVGSDVVDRAVPPWIEHRRNHQRVSDEDDARERQAFNARLVAAIREAMLKERNREEGEDLRW